MKKSIKTTRVGGGETLNIAGEIEGGTPGQAIAYIIEVIVKEEGLSEEDMYLILASLIQSRLEQKIKEQADDRLTDIMRKVMGTMGEVPEA